MNELLESLPEYVQNELDVLTKNGRLPHAIILEGKNTEDVNKVTNYLASVALCKGENKPCTVCSDCVKVRESVHPDVYYTSGSGTNGRINVSDIRRLCSDTFVKPNEGSCKVYIIPDCDLLNMQSQNAFLKSLEEPVQNILYILQCTSQYSLLETIRSRCVTVKIDSENVQSDETKLKQLETAKNIAQALIKKSELDLLNATYFTGKDRDFYIGVMGELKKILASACTGSYNENSKELALKIKSAIDAPSLVKMIDVTDEASSALRRNANMNLLSTWLCSSLQRIKEE